MAPLFFKVDLNKLLHYVQNEENLICAKFGKNLFNISKVIGRKKWPSFFGLTVYIPLVQQVANLHVVIDLSGCQPQKVANCELEPTCYM